MASIGVMDWDLITWKQATFFNIDLMKTSYYHKMNRDYIGVMQDFNPSPYKKSYVFKEYEDYIYPSEITNDPTAEWSGVALYGNKGNNLELELTPADATVYSQLERYYNESKKTKTLFDKMIKGIHIRLSTDGIHINENWEQQISVTEKKFNIFIHDIQPNKLQGTDEILSYVAKTYGKSKVHLGFKYPFLINSETDYLTWTKFKLVNGVNELKSRIFLSDELLYSFQTKEKCFYYYIDESWDYSLFLEKLPEMLLQGFFLSQLNKKLIFQYSSKAIVNPLMRQFLELLNDFFATKANSARKMSVYNFTYRHPNLRAEEKEKIFSFIKEENIELYNLLYSVEYVVYTNQHFKSDLYRTNTEIGGKINDSTRNSSTNKRKKRYYSDIIFGDDAYSKYRNS